MILYVLQEGRYEAGLVGVFSTLEKAMKYAELEDPNFELFYYIDEVRLDEGPSQSSCLCHRPSFRGPHGWYAKGNRSYEPEVPFIPEPSKERPRPMATGVPPRGIRKDEK